MIIYKVVVKKEVFNDLSVIKDFIVTVASVDAAMKYVDALEQEIYSFAVVDKILPAKMMSS